MITDKEMFKSFTMFTVTGNKIKCIARKITVFCGFELKTAYQYL